MPSTATVASGLTSSPADGLTGSLANSLVNSVGAVLPVVIGLLAVITVSYAACYAVACWLAPLARCRRCHGTGHHTRGRGRNQHNGSHRDCRRCHATGRRLRLGRRVWNWIHHEYRDYAAIQPNRTDDTANNSSANNSSAAAS